MPHVVSKTHRTTAISASARGLEQGIADGQHAQEKQDANRRVEDILLKD
jgi:hypothetical protein